MTDQKQSERDPAPEGAGEPLELSEAERELLEKQMKEIRVEDLLAQTVASVLNLSARRILKEDEIDLDQARLGIDAVRALVGLLPTEASAAIQEPLSQIQLLYAQRSGKPAPDAGQDGTSPRPDPRTGGPKGPDRDQGPGEGSGASGLWVPGR